MKYPLLEYVQAQADSNGRAVVSTGPAKYGESWDVTLISVNTNSTLESQLRVYRGVESPSAQVLSTYSGNGDNAGGGTITVPSQDKLVFIWTGCDVGSICTARIEGDLISGRK